MTIYNAPMESGQRFNLCTILRYLDKKGHNHRWLVRCDCGTEFVALQSNLKSGNTKSCGCWRIKVIRDASRKHGMTNTRVYRVWSGIRRRCYDPNNPAFKNYGARGITVCERWTTFENFLADMGEPSVGLSLDRIDNNKGYSPENCRWATRRQQANNMRKNVVLNINGQHKTMAELARDSGIPYATLLARHNKLKWPLERMLDPLHK